MSAYCLDCGEKTQRGVHGSLVIPHAADCPNRRSEPPVPVRVGYCTCAGPAPGYPQHEHHCGWITAEEAGTE